MRRMFKILAILIVVVLGGSYAVYAYAYQGNYDVKTEFKATLNYGTNGYGVSVTDVKSTSESTGMLSFWDAIGDTAASINPANWQVCAELSWDKASFTSETPAIGAISQYLKHSTKVTDLNLTSAGQTKTYTFEFDNIPAGQAQLHIWALNKITQTTTSDRTYDLVVGS